MATPATPSPPSRPAPDGPGAPWADLPPAAYPQSPPPPAPSIIASSTVGGPATAAALTAASTAARTGTPVLAVKRPISFPTVGDMNMALAAALERAQTQYLSASSSTPSPPLAPSASASVSPSHTSPLAPPPTAPPVGSPPTSTRALSTVASTTTSSLQQQRRASVAASILPAHTAAYAAPARAGGIMHHSTKRLVGLADPDAKPPGVFPDQDMARLYVSHAMLEPDVGDSVSMVSGPSGASGNATGGATAPGGLPALATARDEQGPLFPITLPLPGSSHHVCQWELHVCCHEWQDPSPTLRRTPRLCGRKFNSGDALYKHLVEAHAGAPDASGTRCGFCHWRGCTKVFRNSTRYLRRDHFKRHITELVEYICLDCGRKCEKDYGSGRHICREHGAAHTRALDADVDDDDLIVAGPGHQGFVVTDDQEDVFVRVAGGYAHKSQLAPPRPARRMSVSSEDSGSRNGARSPARSPSPTPNGARRPSKSSAGGATAGGVAARAREDGSDDTAAAAEDARCGGRGNSLR
ncbi:hypothetical protein AMAG_20489 [Allomyces macrogynus ATCC 38327]|uniref:Uncharacterized protein n=1 Tax=Allomyces macrogynus (strain ATCC 38327) TaxID=578462 RepID=A0A0L0TCN5_ALLM3|nr:hypothetical protein AMAG_20489 [Allomyces macrogynus ATCC 38327]|eukprot:KNE72643.1 hypothetical protein AMAG_20489 [Allomyces macrogynus ATCC 38327]